MLPRICRRMPVRRADLAVAGEAAPARAATTIPTTTPTTTRSRGRRAPAPRRGRTPRRCAKACRRTYRMRHEAHYVEALVGLRTPVSVAPPAPPAPAAPLAPIAGVPTGPPPPSEAGTLPPPASAPVTTAAPIPTSAVVPAVTGDCAVVAGLTASIRGDAASLDAAAARAAAARPRGHRSGPGRGDPRHAGSTDAAAVLQADPLPALDDVDLVAVCRGVADGLRAGVPAGRRRAGDDGAGRRAPRCSATSGCLTTAVGALLAAVRALVEDNRGDARPNHA